MHRLPPTVLYKETSAPSDLPGYPIPLEFAINSRDIPEIAENIESWKRT